MVHANAAILVYCDILCLTRKYSGGKKHNFEKFSLSFEIIIYLQHTVKVRGEYMSREWLMYPPLKTPSTAVGPDL